MQKILLSIAIILFFYSTQSMATVPLEAYGKLPSKSLMVISPNAQLMAYRDTSNGKDLIVVVDIAKNAIVNAVNINGLNPNNAYFVSDDKLILVASDTKKISGFLGKYEISAAFAFNLSTNKIHQLLTAGYGIYKGQTRLGKIIGVSEDKKYAYMPAYKNAGSYHLYRVDLEKKRKPRIHKRGTSDTIDFFLNDKGEVIARERFNESDNLHRVESYIDGNWQEVFRQETEIRSKGFTGLTPDYKNLVVLDAENDHGRWAYYTMSLNDGTISEAIFSHEDKDVENTLQDLQRVVHGVKYSGFKPSYEFFDKKLNARMRGINKALPNNTFNIVDYSKDWNSIVFYMDGEQSAGDYVFYQNGALSFLGSSRPDVPPEAVHPMQEDNFSARDNLNIPTLLTLPKNSKGKNLPAILLPHGGPESYDRIGFDWMSQFFAEQGYVVIQPQFRGSSGFGPSHLFKGRGEWGQKMQDDLTDAVNHYAKQGLIDKNNVCIVGASYGGYAALAGVTFTPEMYKCAISINGVADVEEMLDRDKYKYGSDHWVVAYWDKVVISDKEKSEQLELISPINHVNKVIAPILLIHGEYDQIVSIAQSEDMYDELKDLNKNVTFIELKKGDHYLSNGENRLKALQEIAKFLKAHLSA
ncbi:prolyl oligopeptidase family serine peptidase [Thalassomonas sp. M1454]|uniref:prolyl oligopeptidase family serine peptidase n=1 Tax=Thalassomonas sp. M1454 TaxID=2594477 RepID=UPI0011803A9E|nr:prolyl oligopeptidase family serine peptidase [Thalassomonas sp. M1454]TRX52339.1 S9 family peptidase [Thalassomonas sp. M1454]